MLELINVTLLVSLLKATIRMATPFTLAAMGGIYSDKSGVLSIELEGLVLMGAFSGFLGAYYTGNLWFGIVLALLSSCFLSFIYGVLTVYLGCKQALVAMAIVLLAVGVTSFMNRALFGITTDYVSVRPFREVSVPLFSRIPYIGEILFQQNILVYISFAIVFFTWFFFNKLSLGLELRALGENPYAADAIGIPVRKYKLLTTLITGMIAGFAGAYLSLASSNTFVEKMSAEKGYAAFAIIILGKYSPIGAFLGCLLYGFADALQLNLQALGTDIPNQFLLMLPYVFTLVVLAISGKGRKPEGYGVFFKKGAEE